MAKKFDLVAAICDHESGELDHDDTLELFSHLIKSGMAWTLQGHYGRLAQSLIESGELDTKGNITGGSDE